MLNRVDQGYENLISYIFKTAILHAPMGRTHGESSILKTGQ